MADSISYVRLFLALTVAGFMAWIMSQVLAPIQPRAADATAGTAAAQGTEWLNTVVSYYPFVAIFIGFLGLIAYSVYRRGSIQA